MMEEKDKNRLAEMVGQEVFDIIERRNAEDMNFDDALNLIKERLDKRGINCFKFDNKQLKNGIFKDITLFNIKKDGDNLQEF